MSSNAPDRVLNRPSLRTTRALGLRTCLWSCLTAGLLALGATSAGASERVWQFRVLLDGDEVGSHSFRVSDKPQGGAREVRSEARFTVRFLFLNAYRYAHEASEQWQGDCLTRIDARTDDDGDILVVRGERRESGFAVEGPKGREQITGCVMSFAYWNPRMLQQTRLLNSQTGLWQDVRIEARGEETLTVRGTPLTTRRYALRGEDLQIDLWYAGADDWVQLESRVAGGRTLRYQRQ